MLLVRNNPIISNTTADLIKIERLLKEVSEAATTGFMELQFNDFSGLILFADGTPLQSIKLKREKSFIVDISEIFQECRKTPVTIGLFTMDKKLVDITLNICRGEPIFENVDSKYVDIRKLLRSLETDNFTGIAVLSTGEEACYITFETGIPLTCICNKGNAIIESTECLENLLKNFKDNLSISAYKRAQKPNIINTLKLLSREVLGEHMGKIEEMLENSGDTKEELLQTIEEIEKVTYLFLDKKKAKTLCKKMKNTVEEVI
jgi:hypothetical protein